MPREKLPIVETVERALAARTREGALGALYTKLDGGKVRCVACGHRCLIPEGRDGVCRVRFNRGGVLHVPHGYVSALNADPIEKKPFYHVLPGATAMSFGMLGCDLHCPYCQNWLTSQTLREPRAVAPFEEITADAIVEEALRWRAPVLVSTYNEPLITSEWAVEVFRRAKPHGIVCGYVSNGNATPEVLRYLRPFVDLYKIDLKSFRDASYRKLGCTLANVLASICLVQEMGFWLEVVTLIVPGFNDDPAEIRDMARFIASVSRDIPWHVIAYHPEYKMEGRATTADDLLRAAAIGRDAGLRHVYNGNLPGRVGDLENTRCPGCARILVERRGHEVLSCAIRETGACPSCGSVVPGLWSVRKGIQPVAPAVAGARKPAQEKSAIL